MRVLSAIVLALAVCGCESPSRSSVKPAAAPTSVKQRETAKHGFAFSHEDSAVQGWPFGLDEPTTKIVVEPAKADDAVESYWVVRLSPKAKLGAVGAFTAEIWVGSEFEPGPFAPVAGADYELLTGTDRNGAETTALADGRFRVRVPAAESAKEQGFIVRARFLGDGDGQEPPKSLIVSILSITDDASGAELPIGQRSDARWLIVDPDAGM
jgi:hypothetical protein